MYSDDELKQLYDQTYVSGLEASQVLLTLRLKKQLHHISLKSHFKVADFGCGNGMLMDLVAPHVESYVGVDFSELFIEAANRRKANASISNAQFICIDIHQFCQMNPEKFDVGFVMDFSEHVYDPEWLRILSHIRSSLQSGGKLYLHTPDAAFFIEKMKKHDFILKQFPSHIAVRTIAENVALIQQAGFEIIEIKRLPHYNILRFLHFLSYIPIIGHYFNARIFIEAQAK